MDLSPYDQCRCDEKLCRIGRSCNILTLALTLLIISGFAIAKPNEIWDKPSACGLQDSSQLMPKNLL